MCVCLCRTPSHCPRRRKTLLVRLSTGQASSYSLGALRVLGMNHLNQLCASNFSYVSEFPKKHGGYDALDTLFPIPKDVYYGKLNPPTSYLLAGTDV